MRLVFHEVSFHEFSFHDDSPLFHEISSPFLEDSGCKCFVIKMRCGTSLSVQGRAHFL